MTLFLAIVLSTIILYPDASVFDAVDAFRANLFPQDALFIARCEALCWSKTNKSSCVKNCLSKNLTKPGRCPEIGTPITSPFDAVCYETCQKDYECPELTKCCHHNCGVTCQQPEQLSSVMDVPNIPQDVNVTETNKKRKNRTIFIEWKPIFSAQEKARLIIYLVQARNHAGRNFIEERLSDWVPCAHVKTKHVTLKNFVKPGRWYQFRVAAVNENGTKGFSKHSPTFSVSIKPKPPKAPHNVTVGPLWTLNGSIYAELRWSPPHSDLPIQKYKVFWSRRLHGAKALDSVLVHQQAVSKDHNKFLLRELQPNSLYFLQIQALVQFGKGRLRGEKSGLILNTTNYTNETEIPTKFGSPIKNRIENLHLQKLYWSVKGLRAKVSWKAQAGVKRYTVSWWTGVCYRNAKPYTHLKYAATTKGTHYNLYDLQFNCRYRVSIRQISEEGMKTLEDTSINFITPSCDEFKKNYRKVPCLQ